ncbi:UDP-4-amino-4,6-dideoxy-N-acetyl-beta-L-altrosamine N-acetyltransferase [Halopseudomonas laoshanensis]|uniref:UDP-4-amino-4, 6-dideoxy-N-acetyl-beta-L-altrosamine N-acetyltransferase n=1 Tax=Halopseudomonas laoshanensis TaxID=2268758 RepID=A0A7V7KUS4_9GAMM|nr:UDP-4-amino-4,6-dideoxy-N-acetyl-beta-L-altrosamine N-acetyltransferase [Halopseudomonas laoshanensis]KAA0690873.1 UDP-4-amino-4,6-dideoxy-N-acetyl-beta-L-altrosamine N-acetyltransferase [Halopseudomonas laoshanensis]
MAFSDLEQVLKWRNHAEVRRYMYTQHEITMNEHVSWFDHASKQLDRHLLIFEREGLPLGFINIHEIAVGGIAEWGFYAAPDAPKGSGQLLGRCVLTHAFSELGLHKVCGQALAFNERSIKFHLGIGFEQEGTLRDQFFDGQKYHAVMCFGLLAADWPTNKEM